MRLVIQRVTEASVTIDGTLYSRIGKGYLVLAGVNLRIFEDENGKTNLSLRDVGGEVLLVSQFTLYADTRRGNRPGFTRAGRPETAEPLYEYLVEKTREQVPVVEKGVFGADMKVALLNDGPFTILLDSEQM